MKKAAGKALWVLWLVLAGALPAYANNPPAPDGMLSILLIFPVAMLAYRFAGAKPTEKEQGRRFLSGLGLGVCFFLTLGGTEIAIIPLLILLYYGVRRGVLACVRGQGWKRFAIGATAVLFTFFAVANYLASLAYYPGAMMAEATGVGRLRNLATALETFKSARTLDLNKNGVGEYGSFEQLKKAGLLDPGWELRGTNNAYQYALILSGDPTRDEKEFFVYATPTNYGEVHWTLSLIGAMRPQRRYAKRTFASDETGVIRASDLGGSRAVTREEAQKWPPVQ
jgi:hypothetical protein